MSTERVGPKKRNNCPKGNLYLINDFNVGARIQKIVTDTKIESAMTGEEQCSRLQEILMDWLGGCKNSKNKSIWGG